MIRRPPRSTLSSSSAASDVYKRQSLNRLSRSSSGEVAGAADGEVVGCPSGALSDEGVGPGPSEAAHPASRPATTSTTSSSRGVAARRRCPAGQDAPPTPQPLGSRASVRSVPYTDRAMVRTTGLIEDPQERGCARSPGVHQSLGVSCLLYTS